jgi:hypothetical protein
MGQGVPREARLVCVGTNEFGGAADRGSGTDRSLLVWAKNCRSYGILAP